VKLQKTGKRSAVVWNFREGGGMNRWSTWNTLQRWKPFCMTL
jgi:hypothetical protein